MDYFTNKKFIIGVIAGLILLNLLTIATFWFKLLEPKPFDPFHNFQRMKRVNEFLKNELKLNDKQIDEFIKLRKKHFENTKSIAEQIHELKNTLLNEVTKPNADTNFVRLVIDKIAVNQAELDRKTFEHFLNLKLICTSEQVERFNLLIKEIIRIVAPPELPQPPPPMFLQPLFLLKG